VVDGGAHDQDAAHGALDASLADDFEPATEIALSSISQGKDDDPALTGDLTQLYFDSRRDGGSGREDLWHSTRASASDAWATPAPVAELNTSGRETGIALAADGLTVWFSSDRSGGAGGLDVYVATRATPSAAFEPATRVESLSSKGDDQISFVDPSQTTAFMARRDGEDDDYDLYIVRRATQLEPWSAATPLTALNTDEGESDAFSVEGGARLLFTRAGDLYLAERGASPDEYAQAVPLTSVNSEQDDRDPWASEDLRYLVFSSKRSGSYLLYEARRR
jgi:Tol biopolymer transport system component